MVVVRSIDFNTNIGGNQSISILCSRAHVTYRPLPGTAPVIPLTYTPLLHPSAELVWPSNSANNLLQGVIYRIKYVKDPAVGWKPPPSPTVDIKTRFARIVKSFAHYIHPITPMSTEAYLKSCDPARRARYQAVVERLYVTQPPRTKQFVKLEPANSSEKEPVARIITDPGPQYNFEIGRFIKPVEHAIMKSLLSWLGYQPIMKGLNAKEIATDFKETWDSYDDPVWLDGDASRFDAHTGIPIRRDLEFVIYSLFFPGYPELKTYLHRSLRRVVKAYTRDGVVSHEMDNRGSGNHNTGIGNCIITVMMLVLWIDECKLNCSIKNNGDDWGVICSRRDMPKFKAGFVEFCLTLGYNMQIGVETDVFERISFCQTNPVLGPDGYIMCRDPRKCRSKDLTTHKVKRESEYRRWCASVAESGLAMSSGIPVLQEFYTSIHRSALGSKPGKFFDKFQGRIVLSKGLTHKRSVPTADSRYSFFLAFGYTPDEQVALEEEYSAVSTIAFCSPKLYDKEFVSVADHTIHPLRPSF